ncbi:MAG: hypothetical protein GC157_00555 [Frankiales bacterium]|nr:hypothetical protein [Frankiales bacterium]
MERLIEFIIAIPLVAYPILLAVGTWRGKVRLYKCTVDARHDLRMRAAFPEMDEQSCPVIPLREGTLVDHDDRT